MMIDANLELAKKEAFLNEHTKIQRRDEVILER